MLLPPASSGWGPEMLLNVLRNTAPTAQTDLAPKCQKLRARYTALKVVWVLRDGEGVQCGFDELGFQTQRARVRAPPPWVSECSLLSLSDFICEMGAATDESTSGTE